MGGRKRKVGKGGREGEGERAVILLKAGLCSEQGDRCPVRKPHSAPSLVTHRLLSGLYDLMLAPPGPVPGPKPVWVTVETHIRPRGRGRRRRCSRVKSILPAARGLSQVTPGQAAPASCPDPLAPKSGPPISGPHHRETPRLLWNSEHCLVASGSVTMM